MIRSLRITALVENTAGARGLSAEHGLAMWIEADGRKVLFDTGQGLALPHNAEALEIDLQSVSDVVLSHGHYDHSGGLPGLVGKLQQANVWVHPAAFEAKFGRDPQGIGQPIRAPIQDADEIRPHVANVASIPA